MLHLYVIGKRNIKKTNNLISQIDIVLVFEDKVPRQNWCLGRIKELIRAVIIKFVEQKF